MGAQQTSATPIIISLGAADRTTARTSWLHLLQLAVYSLDRAMGGEKKEKKEKQGKKEKKAKKEKRDKKGKKRKKEASKSAPKPSVHNAA